MPRRYRRTTRYVPARKPRYSSETMNTFSVIPAVQTASPVFNQGVSVVAPAAIGGLRKAKNFTIKLGNQSANWIVWALVYVPEGTVPSQLSVPFSQADVTPQTASSIYEPNQNVILTGVLPPHNPSSAVPTTIAHSRLARNLNSNDGIFLIFQCHNTTGADTVQGGLFIQANYALTF